MWMWGRDGREVVPCDSQGLCSVLQLQVSSLLSNVFKLLMTHKVRPGWGACTLVRQEGGLWERQVASGLWQVLLLWEIFSGNVLYTDPFAKSAVSTP